MLLLLELPGLKFHLSYFLRSVANRSQVFNTHARRYDATFILRHAVCFHGAHWNHGFVFILNTEKSLRRTWNESKKQRLVLKWFLNERLLSAEDKSTLSKEFIIYSTAAEGACNLIWMQITDLNA